MSNYSCKNIDGGILDVDTKSRRVKVVISKMGNLDYDNDVIDHGAYNKTIKERGPQGANLVWHLSDHQPSLKSAFGKFHELYVQGDQLIGVDDIVKTAWGNDGLELYAAGLINQHSVGFKTIKSEIANKGKHDEHRVIKEIQLYEGSAVLFGANDQTPTLAVGKSLTKEDREKEYLTTLEEVNKLHKLFKSGHVTDETYELLEMQLIQKTDKLKQLFDLHTQPAANAVEPTEGEELLSVFKTFNNSLILQNGIKRTVRTTA
jgi:HK97 family phage prohead protease